MAQLSIWLWDLGLHSQMNFPEMEQCWTIHCLLTLLSHRRLSFHTVLQKWDSPYPKWWRVLTKLFILLKSQLSDRNKTKNYPWVTMYNWRHVFSANKRMPWTQLRLVDLILASRPVLSKMEPSFVKYITTSGNSVRLYFWGLQNHCRWWLQPWN